MYRTIAVVAAALLASSALADDKKAITRADVTVKGSNDEWTPTGLNVEKGDVLLIEAKGKVKVGSWIGEVGPGGNGDGIGVLSLKVADGKAVKVGAKFFATVEESSGPLKLKVADTKYEDNDGAFTVTVLKIPAAAIPAAATPVAADAK